MTSTLHSRSESRIKYRVLRFEVDSKSRSRNRMAYKRTKTPLCDVKRIVAFAIAEWGMAWMRHYVSTLTGPSRSGYRMACIRLYALRPWPSRWATRLCAYGTTLRRRKNRRIERCANNTTQWRHQDTLLAGPYGVQTTIRNDVDRTVGQCKLYVVYATLRVDVDRTIA